LVLIGAVASCWIESWGWLDSTCNTVITLTTMGFGDSIPVTPLGTIVTAFYGLNGIAILLALFDNMRRVRALRYERAVHQVKDKEARTDQ